MRKRVVLAFSLTLPALSAPAREQSRDTKIGEKFSLRSTVLNEVGDELAGRLVERDDNAWVNYLDDTQQLRWLIAWLLAGRSHSPAA